MKGGSGWKDAKTIFNKLSKPFSNYKWNRDRAKKKKDKIHLPQGSNIKILIRPNRLFSTIYEEIIDPQYVIERYEEENARRKILVNDIENAIKKESNKQVYKDLLQEILNVNKLNMEADEKDEEGKYGERPDLTEFKEQIEKMNKGLGENLGSMEGTKKAMRTLIERIILSINETDGSNYGEWYKYDGNPSNTVGADNLVFSKGGRRSKRRRQCKKGRKSCKKSRKSRKRKTKRRRRRRTRKSRK
tara:strand:+ start:403 stop:1137 length:735 start_codon:yes stop_codon:yes gene_type:complete